MTIEPFTKPFQLIGGRQKSLEEKKSPPSQGTSPIPSRTNGSNWKAVLGSPEKKPAPPFLPRLGKGTTNLYGY